VHYQDGQISRVEEDTNRDGRSDSFSYYENGQLVRKDLDRKHVGKIDLSGYYQNGRLVRQEEDLHGDGKISRIIFFAAMRSFGVKRTQRSVAAWT
jgi:antitoxin component YwqK of YwqJK toxin-antitoxin module